MLSLGTWLFWFIVSLLLHVLTAEFLACNVRLTIQILLFKRKQNPEHRRPRPVGSSEHNEHIRDFSVYKMVSSDVSSVVPSML